VSETMWKQYILLVKYSQESSFTALNYWFHWW